MIRITIKNRTKLVEMPIVGLHKIGDFSRPSSIRPSTQGFEDNDIKLLNNPKAIEKIQKLWLGSKVPLNLILINRERNTKSPDGFRYKLSGKSSDNYFPPEEEPEIVQAQELLLPDAINFAILGNWGPGKVPLSGWIIAHKLSHAILDSKFIDIKNEITIEPSNEYRPQKIKKFAQEIRDLFKNQTGIFCTSKAGRTGKLSDHAEALHEIFAQFIFAGEVNFGNFDDIMDKNDIVKEKFYNFINDFVEVQLKVRDDPTKNYRTLKVEADKIARQTAENVLSELKSNAESIFADELKNSIGELYYD